MKNRVNILFHVALVGAVLFSAAAIPAAEQRPAGQASRNGAPSAERIAVGKGDLATVNYTMTLEDGTLVATTDRAVAGDQGRKRIGEFPSDAIFRPEQVLAGSPASVPGIGETVVGMEVGRRAKVVLPPEKAFGLPDPQKRVQLPTTHTIPRIITMPAREYVSRFDSLPVVGKDVTLVPYFPARVTKVDEGGAELEFSAVDGTRFEEKFGQTVVAVKGDEITITLQPRMGAPFEMGGKAGTIVSGDGTTFTVDFNGPLAGKTVVAELEVTGRADAASFAGVTIPWQENYDGALTAARRDGKPTVLVLYADWCQWCKRLLTESLVDPRVLTLRDSFVWAKVNSDKETSYKDKYGQNGFPLVVVLDREGAVIRRIDGFRDARALRDELAAIL